MQILEMSPQELERVIEQAGGPAFINLISSIYAHLQSHKFDVEQLQYLRSMCKRKKYYLDDYDNDLYSKLKPRILIELATKIFEQGETALRTFTNSLSRADKNLLAKHLKSEFALAKQFVSQIDATAGIANLAMYQILIPKMYPYIKLSVDINKALNSPFAELSLQAEDLKLLSKEDKQKLNTQIAAINFDILNNKATPEIYNRLANNIIQLKSVLEREILARTVEKINVCSSFTTTNYAIDEENLVQHSVVINKLEPKVVEELLKQKFNNELPLQDFNLDEFKYYANLITKLNCSIEEKDRYASLYQGTVQLIANHRELFEELTDLSRPESLYENLDNIAIIYRNLNSAQVEDLEDCTNGFLNVLRSLTRTAAETVVADTESEFGQVTEFVARLKRVDEVLMRSGVDSQTAAKFRDIVAEDDIYPIYEKQVKDNSYFNDLQNLVFMKDFMLDNSSSPELSLKVAYSTHEFFENLFSNEELVTDDFINGFSKISTLLNSLAIAIQVPTERGLILEKLSRAKDNISFSQKTGIGLRFKQIFGEIPAATLVANIINTYIAKEFSFKNLSTIRGLANVMQEYDSQSACREQYMQYLVKACDSVEKIENYSTGLLHYICTELINDFSDKSAYYNCLYVLTQKAEKQRPLTITDLQHLREYYRQLLNADEFIMPGITAGAAQTSNPSFRKRIFSILETRRPERAETINELRNTIKELDFFIANPDQVATIPENMPLRKTNIPKQLNAELTKYFTEDNLDSRAEDLLEFLKSNRENIVKEFLDSLDSQVRDQIAAEMTELSTIFTKADNTIELKKDGNIESLLDGGVLGQIIALPVIANNHIHDKVVLDRKNAGKVRQDFQDLNNTPLNYDSIILAPWVTDLVMFAAKKMPPLEKDNSPNV